MTGVQTCALPIWVILFVDDDTDGELTEKVRQAKREGLIDAFLFGSVSENYFASVIDSV